MKPVALIAAQRALTTRPGDLGDDHFAWSDSTLIAAEQLWRKCVAVEIEPRLPYPLGQTDLPSPPWSARR